MSLTRAADVDALLQRLDWLQEHQEPNRLSERAVVAHALGCVGDERAVNSLASLLQPDERDDARVCAAFALRNIGGHAAERALTVALNDKQRLARKAAYAVITRDSDPAA
jgi:HEAT repeat protein